MLEQKKNNLLLILGIFFVWVLGSIYVYTCVLKGFCDNDTKIIEKDKVVLEEEKYDEEELNYINNLEDDIDIQNNSVEEDEIVEKSTTFSKRTIKCYTHINSVIKINSNRNIKSEVEKLETFFNKYYKTDLKIDGVYDLEDLNEVKEFQTLKNLDNDGVVGPKTLKVINAIYCVKNEKNN